MRRISLGPSVSAVAAQPVTLGLSAGANAVLSLVIPAGNWTANNRGSRLWLRDATGTLFGGLTRVTLRSRDGVHYSVTLSAKHLDLAGANAADLTAAVGVESSSYVGAAACTANRRGTRVTCKAKR